MTEQNRVKAILVIDIPNICIKCPLCAREELEFFCVMKREKGKDLYNKELHHEKPVWCPLRPMSHETLKELDVELYKEELL